MKQRAAAILYRSALVNPIRFALSASMSRTKGDFETDVHQ
jgi:hypothetical protein